MGIAHHIGNAVDRPSRYSSVFHHGQHLFDRARGASAALRNIAFADPDPWQQMTYASALDARRGIATLLSRPLGKLADADLQFVDDLVSRTLDKAEIAEAVRARFIKPHD